MNKKVWMTKILFSVTLALDWITTKVLLSNPGFYETNLVSSLLGIDLFLAVYFLVSGALLILVAWFELRYSWSYLVLCIPITVHGVCGLHNLQLWGEKVRG